MADIETISDTHTALEQCGDLFRAGPVECNPVASAVSPTVDFEMHRAARDGTTIGAAVRIGDTCTVTRCDPEAIAPLGEALPIDAPMHLRGPAGTAADIAGQWMTRSNGSVTNAELVRLHRLVALHEPSKRRKGKAFTSERSRFDEATAWSVGFGADTGRARTAAEARSYIEQAVNESRLIEWRVKGDVVAQLVISAARFGVVRISEVYTPPELRKRGHAAALTAAVAAQQLERQKVDDIILTTHASDPSTSRLYRRLGFEPVLELLHLTLAPGRPQTT